MAYEPKQVEIETKAYGKLTLPVFNQEVDLNDLPFFLAHQLLNIDGDDGAAGVFIVNFYKEYAIPETQLRLKRAGLQEVLELTYEAEAACKEKEAEVLEPGNSTPKK